MLKSIAVRSPRATLALVLFCAAAAVPIAWAADSAPDASSLKQHLLETPPDYLQAREAMLKSMQVLYKNRSYQPAWIDNSEVQATASSLLTSLSKADEHGLRVSDYGVDDLRKRLSHLQAGELTGKNAIAQLDLRLSYAFIDYAQDLHSGRIDPKAVDPRWITDLPRNDYAQSLATALDNEDVAGVLANMAPPQPAYRRLQTALFKYRAQTKNGDWPKVPEGDLIEVGDSSPRVVALRQRLTASGELGEAASADSPKAKLYDQTLADALSDFQRRHGRVVDGLLGEGSVKALNASLEQRIRDIEINLERWRWLPDDLGERYIVVNVPDFSLAAYSDGKPDLGMGVIVGEQYNDRATPIFTDTMQRLVFRPYWGIPHSIATEEILPEAREDIGYLAQKNYQIVANYRADARVYATTPANLEKVARGELRLRQDAGPQNSLGLVKFLFPNQFAVYLHDTPADHLFAKDRRAFSHGCIRVERPAQLAEWTLNRQSDWDLARVESAMHSGGRQQVELDSSIPVYILYWTAFVDDAGQVQFRPDLYGHDEMLNKALSQAISQASGST